MEPMETRIARIMQMEQLFDTLLLHEPDSIRTDPNLRQMLKDLIGYYEGGQWLEDYLSDEWGALPAGLKRGVLSQDGVYNLLFRLKNPELSLDNGEPLC